MKLKYQITQKLKTISQATIFLVSYQDEAIYRRINQDIREQHQLAHQHHITLQNPDQWQELGAKTQHYSLFAEPQAYEIEILSPALKLKTLPKLQPLATDIFIFKTQDFKSPLLEKIHALPATLWIQAYQARPLELWRYLKLQTAAYILASEIETWFIQQQQIDFNLCQELIDKIHLSFKPKQMIQLADIQNLLGFASQELNWSPVITTWMQRNQQQAITAMRQLNFKDSDLILLVWLLGRQTQVLYALKQGIQAEKDIFNHYKLWPKQQDECRQALPLFSIPFLEFALSDLQKIDFLLKSGQGISALQKIERLFLMDA